MISARRHAGDRHSRVVAWLKIALPLLALAMLSTIFLVSRVIDPSKGKPPDDTDVEALARDQRVGAPTAAGVARDGSEIEFSADSVLPRADRSGALAMRPVVRVRQPDGRTLSAQAETGNLDRPAGLLTLRGAVEIETSDGYRLTTDELTARLDAGEFESAGPVHGTAPFGTLDAGRMALTKDPRGVGILRFENGVKLLYQPDA